MKNTTEKVESKKIVETKKTEAAKQAKASSSKENVKPLESAPSVPIRPAFGELTNSQMAPCLFPEDGHIKQTEMPEMFFGVSKPFFSNTYKKREKKLAKKLSKSKND